MNDLIVYIFKSAIWIAVFYGIYRFFFRQEIFFRFNRGFLLTGLLAPFVLALCQLRYPVEVVSLALSGTESTPVTVSDTAAVSFDRMTFFLWAYVAGALALFLYYGLGLNKIRKLIHQQNAHSGEKSNMIYIPGIRSSFSFFGYVFMDSQAGLQDIEKEVILAHETAHIEQLHWIDVLLAQLVCIFQWFNPFAWLYLNAVKQNHEFLADRSVIDKGYSPAVYQAVLINSTFRVPVFAFTNSFAYYPKFKRIEIMKKNISKPAKKLAVLLLLPAFAGFLAAFAQPEYHYSVLPSQEAKAPVSQNDTEVTEDSQIPVKAADSEPVQKPQMLKVAGQVLDTDGKPVAGAAILQKEAKTGTVTDADGKFALSVPANSQLEVIYFDKEKAIVDLKNSVKGKLISVTLKDEQNKPVEKSDSISVVKGVYTTCLEKSDSIMAMNVPMEIRTLSDRPYKLSGIVAFDEHDTISIRGENHPLIIVDGKEYTSSSLKNIEPKNIKTITVLKYKSATDIYGEKGKNGVVIIELKEITEL